MGVESQPLILSHGTSWAKLTCINVLRQDDSEQFDLGMYSCFYEVGILRLTTVDKVIDFLGPEFTRYGYPFSVKSDNGPQFISQVFKYFLIVHGIEHRTSPPLLS